MNWCRWKPEKMEDRRFLLREPEELRTRPGHSSDQDTILHLAAEYPNDFIPVKQPESENESKFPASVSDLEVKVELHS